MQILILTASLGIGGAETHILALVRELVSRGHGVTVAASGGVYLASLLRCGAAYRPLPLDQRSPRAYLRARRGIAALLAEQDFDVIHAHTRPAARIAAPLARKANLPLVTTAHWTFDSRFPKDRLSEWGERTLAVSPDIREYLISDFHVYPDNIGVTVNGIDVTAFSPPASPPPPLSVITVSRLDRGRAKTAILACRAAAYLGVRYPDFTLTVVGDGDRYAAVRAEAERTNRYLGRPCVTLLGRRTDVAPCLREHAIFIGASRAALEALAAGCVTLLSGDEGYLSLFTETTAPIAAHTNFCFRGAPPVTESALIRDLLRLFAMPPAERERLSAYGRRYVTLHYSITRMGQDAEDLYKSVLRRPLLCKSEETSPHIPSLLPHLRSLLAGRSVLLCGYYGHNNLGDEATLRAALRTLYACGATRITVAASHPRAVARREGVSAVSPLAPLAFFSALRRSDVVVFGGGTLLQDATSRRSLLFYTGICRLSQRLRRPLVALAGGIGTLSPRGAQSVRTALAGASLLLRTPRDVAAAGANGVAPRSLLLLPDLLFSPLAEYAYSAWKDTDISALFAKNKPLFAKTAARPLLLFALRGSVSVSLAGAVRRIAEEHALTPVFCVLSPEDAAPARRYAAHTGGCATRLLSPAALRALLEKSAAAVGNRLHLLILSLLAGVTPVAVAYDEKIVYFADFVNETLQNLRNIPLSPPTALRPLPRLSCLPAAEEISYASLSAALGEAIPRASLLAVAGHFRSLYL